MPMEVHEFRLPLATEEELHDFLALAFGVRIPDRAICAGHQSPFAALADAYFARHRVSLWHASRGFGGKSFLLAMLALAEACTLKANVSLLGGSGQQSQRIHQYLADAWNYESSPRGLLPTDALKMETRLIWGNSIQALLASQSSVRGPHPQRLRLDEVDEMERSILDAALGQPMSTRDIPAQTVLSSTHHHPSGTMSYAVQMAAEKGWGRFTWCYRETSAPPYGWLDPAEVAAKRSDVPQVMWRTEYDLESPSAEGLAIMPSAIAQTFQADLGVHEGAEGQYLEFEAPESGAQYRTGADWAKSQNWTIVFTIRIDVSPGRLVAFERLGRRAWPVMVSRFEFQVKRYNSEGVYDATGLGSVVQDYLNVEAEGVILVGKVRSGLLSEYISHLEHGDMVAPDIAFMKSEHQHARVQDVYGAGHLPDSICAGALAWKDLERIPDEEDEHDGQRLSQAGAR